MAEQEQIRFLRDALGAVSELSEKKESFEREQQLFKESERALETLKRKIEREKETKVRTNRSDVESGYDRQIRQTEAEIGREETKRQKSRNQAVKERVRMETAGLRSANENLKMNIGRILKERNMPKFCGQKAFLVLFSPRGILEILQMFLVFLFCLVILPLIVTFFIRSPGWKAAVFAVIDLAVIGLYALIYLKIAVPFKDGINLCHDETDKIRANEKQIRKLTKSIRRDKDDSRYDLVQHDAELTRLNQRKSETMLKKQQALTEFDAQTAGKIRDDVDKEYAQKLEETCMSVQKHSAAVKQLGDEAVALDQKINSTYTQYLGARNMTVSALEEKIALLEKGAESVRELPEAEEKNSGSV